MEVSVIVRKIRTAIRSPRWILIRGLIYISPLLRDDIYLKMLFPLRTGYRLNLKDPSSYNEKLQWLKINYRLPIMTKMADKYEAKNYVGERIGCQYVVKTLGIWDSFDQIDFGLLPDSFVLKTTHDSGGIVICKDKAKFNREVAEQKLNYHLNTKNYFITREWPYRNIRPRIMAEVLLNGDENGDLLDYKFFCFNGCVKAMFVASERQSGSEVKFDFFDENFNPLDIVQTHPRSGRVIQKPEGFDTMVELAEELSAGFPHVRIDFYNVNGKIYFGEFTFFHHGGIVPFKPKSWDYTFGNWIDFETKKVVK